MNNIDVNKNNNNKNELDTIKEQQYMTTTVARKRRHFRDDFKRKILNEIYTGKLSIHKVRDETGAPIKPLLVERWKDQLRTEGFGGDYVQSAPIMAEMSFTTQSVKSAFSADSLLREIGRLEMENRQLRSIIQRSAHAVASSNFGLNAASR